MRKVKVGVVGLGGRGCGQIWTMLACEEADIVKICDKNPERLQIALDVIKEKEDSGQICFGDHTKVATCTDYREILNDKDIEAVVITSSWDSHIKIAIDSMKAGKITAMEVGGAYTIEECWQLVHAYEETKTPIMMLENCCFDRFELLTTALHRAGKLGEISHCHGAYRHDLRDEILGGNVRKHYRLKNYIKRNCENYPTHELGPIAKLLGVNRGNRLLSLVSVASKAQGLEAFSYSDKNPDKNLTGKKFNQGDVVNTIIKCTNGETITLTLNTCLPCYYSREFEVFGTKGLCRQEDNMVMLEEDVNMEEFWEPTPFVEKHLNNANNYGQYLPDFWRNITEEQKKSGHGGMDLYMFKVFFDCVINNKEMPVDVYDAATWMCITALSEQSVATGGTPQFIPDFTNGAWVTRERKDVVDFPEINE